MALFIWLANVEPVSCFSSTHNKAYPDTAIFDQVKVIPSVPYSWKVFFSLSETGFLLSPVQTTVHEIEARFCLCSARMLCSYMYLRLVPPCYLYYGRWLCFTLKTFTHMRLWLSNLLGFGLVLSWPPRF